MTSPGCTGPTPFGVPAGGAAQITATARASASAGTTTLGATPATAHGAAGRRTGQDDIALQQREQPGNVGHEHGHRKYHVRRAPMLPHLAVDGQREREASAVDALGGHKAAHRAERLEALGHLQSAPVATPVTRQTHRPHRRRRRRARRHSAVHRAREPPHRCAQHTRRSARKRNDSGTPTHGSQGEGSVGGIGRRAPSKGGPWSLLFLGGSLPSCQSRGSTQQCTPQRPARARCRSRGQ